MVEVNVSHALVVKGTWKMSVVFTKRTLLSLPCMCVYCQTISFLRQHGEKYREMDLLSLNLASSMCCYGSGWEGNQIPPSLSPPNAVIVPVHKGWGDV